MAISQVDVYNLALVKLGQDRASSTSEDVEQVRTLNSVYPIVLDTVLAEHPWRFAIKRAELAALVGGPTWGYTYRYQLPEPGLRIVEVGDDWVWNYTKELGATFALEGVRTILSDQEAPLRVRYVERPASVGDWPPLFSEAVAMKLAMRCALKLTNSNAREESCAADYDDTIRRARRQNAIARPPAILALSDWLDARGG